MALKLMRQFKLGRALLHIRRLISPPAHPLVPARLLKHRNKWKNANLVAQFSLLFSSVCTMLALGYDMLLLLLLYPVSPLRPFTSGTEL